MASSLLIFSDLIDNPVPHLASFTWLQMMKFKILYLAESEDAPCTRSSQIVLRQFDYDHPFCWFANSWSSLENGSTYLVPIEPNSRELLLLGIALINLEVS